MQCKGAKTSFSVNFPPVHSAEIQLKLSKRIAEVHNEPFWYLQGMMNPARYAKSRLSETNRQT